MSDPQQDFGEIITQVPPSYCQYASGKCDQTFQDVPGLDALFLYPSKPQLIAETIEEAIKRLGNSIRVAGWKNLQPTGQVIFCAICKQLRFSSVAVTDVTTLNFNLLFEIGYAVGLGIPVLPIRDTTFLKDKHAFTELGMLDAIGYIDFQNSQELADKISTDLPHAKRFEASYELNQEQPIFVVKSPIATDASARLTATVAKTGLRARTFDPVETTRITLHEAARQVRSSLGVIVHLIDNNRDGATVHNARGALMAGLAMAGEKLLVVLQEGEQAAQPLDYRDLVRSYTSANQIPGLLRDFARGVIERFQATKFASLPQPQTPLQKVDLGDIAAENERFMLQDYFVRTAQYEEVRRGRAQLVIGRKGSGKSAIFYEIQNQISASKDNLVVDLRPEGHQFIRLRETVLKHLSQGAQEHLLTAFWDYLLAIEVIRAIITTDKAIAYRDADRLRQYETLREFLNEIGEGEEGDFTELLLDLEERISQQYGDVASLEKSGEITQLIYAGDIKRLTDTLVNYLRNKDAVWLLFDNIDKGLPVEGASFEDVLIVRCLRDAARKLQRRLENAGIEFHPIIFLRSDIYDLLVEQTPDRGKDSVAYLDWDTEESFQELVVRRIETSAKVSDKFDVIWPAYFEPFMDGQPSFKYVMSRTFHRPRDVIRFLKHAINQALNRSHTRVNTEDFETGERLYSEDQLTDISYELRDVSQKFGDLLYAFIAEPRELSQGDLFSILHGANIPDEEADQAIRLLVWFSFLGVIDKTGDEKYAYQYRHNVDRLMKEVGGAGPTFVTHPAFRKALGTEG
jgi:hypothetical protein